MWNECIWRQLGAAIDMLDDAIRNCPDALWIEDLWDDPSAPGLAAYWYLAYHTLFWLEYDLAGADPAFKPRAPFGLEEMDPAGLLPPRVYSRAELRDYIAHCRRAGQTTIQSLTDEAAGRICRVGSSGQRPFAELLIYTMRHVQEHAAQLNMFLGQRGGSVAGWVGAAKDA
jgi:hypothetical protein